MNTSNASPFWTILPTVCSIACVHHTTVRRTIGYALLCDQYTGLFSLVFQAVHNFVYTFHGLGLMPVTTTRGKPDEAYE